MTNIAYFLLRFGLNVVKNGLSNLGHQIVIGLRGVQDPICPTNLYWLVSNGLGLTQFQQKYG